MTSGAAQRRVMLEEAGGRLEAARVEQAAALELARAEAIAARREGWPVEAIAGALRVTRRSVQRWLEDEAKGTARDPWRPPAHRG